ncbi:hypothetical protein [Brevibacillus agri]|uniref:hypothetical protein n=1 Tax=Brevibacillus agri TaxID=51101 RepID=UPI001EE5DA25|nr:hypothetical protein [Brevibacillus agri]MCG5254741.1 hypothetical protein [Brevibacillus agri]
MLWTVWIIFEFPTQDVQRLLFVVVGGAIAIPLYFSIVYLLKGDSRKKWIAWLVITLTPFTIAPAAMYIFAQFIVNR